jgi:hypothetical protein
MNRKALLDGLITAAVGLGETIELQKGNAERRQQLSYICRSLRQYQTRRLPEGAGKVNRSHLRMVLRDRQYLERDRRQLAKKTKHFRDMINWASADVLKRSL